MGIIIIDVTIYNLHTVYVIDVRSISRIIMDRAVLNDGVPGPVDEEPVPCVIVDITVRDGQSDDEL